MKPSQDLFFINTKDLMRAEFWVGTSFSRKLDNYVRSFWLDCELNKFNMSSLTPELTFSDFRFKEKLIWNFQNLISFGTYVFWALNIPHIDEKDWNPQYLHVKHENTRKNMIKMDENTLFSQIDKILNIHSRFVE